MVKFVPTNPDNLRTDGWASIDQICLIDKNQNLNKRMLSARLLVFISGYYLALSDLRQSPSDEGDSTSDCCCLVMAPSYFPNYRVTASLVWPNILLDRSPSHQTDRLADWHQYFQEQMFFFCLRMSTIYLIWQLIDICMNLFMISLSLSLSLSMFQWNSPRVWVTPTVGQQKFLGQLYLVVK